VQQIFLVRIDMSPTAFAGGKKVIEYFIVAARISGRSFVAGPVWNYCDSLIPDYTQHLRFAFSEGERAAIPFPTEDLEKYGAGHIVTMLLIEAKIHSLVDPKLDGSLAAAGNRPAEEPGQTPAPALSRSPARDSPDYPITDLFFRGTKCHHLRSPASGRSLPASSTALARAAGFPVQGRYRTLRAI
jgi:hypothetical protein